MGNIAIVGHHGFLAQRLLSSNKFSGTITTTSRKSNAPGSLYLDLGDPLAFDYRTLESVSTVILLAAISAPEECNSNYDHAYLVNVIGTSEFIKSCIALGVRVIFASSDVVYGECSNEVDEGDDLNPVGPYAKMKAEVENRFSYSRLFRAIRFSYIFARNDKFTRFVLDCIEEKRVCEIFEPFSRSVVYVDDVVDGIAALCCNWGAVPSNVINFSGTATLARRS